MLQRQGPFEVELSEPAFVADTLVADAHNASGSYCPLPLDPSFSTNYHAISAAVIALPENPLTSRSEKNGEMLNESAPELSSSQGAVEPLPSNASNSDKVV